MTANKYSSYLSPCIFTLVLVLSPSRPPNINFSLFVELSVLIVLMLLIAYQYIVSFKKEVFIPTQTTIIFYSSFIFLGAISLIWTVSDLNTSIAIIRLLSSLLVILFAYNLDKSQYINYLSLFKLLVITTAIFTIYQSLITHGEPSGFFMYRNENAAFMLMLLIPLCCQFLIDHQENKKPYLLASIISLVSFAIALTTSRSVFFILMIDYCLLATVFIMSRQANTVMSFIKLAAFLTLGIILANLLLEENLVDRVAETGLIKDFSQQGQTGRGVIWHAAWQMFLDKPFYGWGLGSFFLLYPQYKTPLDIETGYFVHNDYLQFLVELGPLGLLVFLGFVGSLLIHGYRFCKKAQSGQEKYTLSLLVACLGLFIQSVFDFNMYLITLQLLMGFYLGGFLRFGSEIATHLIPAERISAKKYYWIGGLVSFAMVLWISRLAAFFYFMNESTQEGYTEKAIHHLEIADIFYSDAGVYESQMAGIYMMQLSKAQPENVKIIATELLNMLNVAIAKNPTLASNYLNRATVLIALDKNQKEKIMADFEMALKMNPCYLEARKQYAHYLDAEQQPTQALNMLWMAWNRVYRDVNYQTAMNYLNFLQDYNNTHGSLNDNAKIIRVREQIATLAREKISTFVYFQ